MALSTLARSLYRGATCCFALLVAIMLAGCSVSTLDRAANTASSSTSSTGTSARTFAVQDYGALGNGVADDAPAIARALAAAMAAGGGSVTFPCGEFNLRSAPNPAPGSRSMLYIKGAANIALSGDGSCSHVFTTQPLTSVFEFDASSQISFANMRLSAVNMPMGTEHFGMDGGSAIRLNAVTGGSITGVEIDGAAIGAIYLTAGTSHVTVAKNSIHDTYGSGIWEDNCGGQSALSCAPYLAPAYNIFQANTLTDTSRDLTSAFTLDDGGSSDYALVEGNTFTWTRPLVAGNYAVFCLEISHTSDVQVLNNTCTNAPYDGIVILGAGNAPIARDVIQGNTISGTGSSGQGGSSIILWDQTTGLGISNFTIANNTISNSAGDGITLISSVTAGSINNGLITGNTITLVDQRNPGSSYGVNIVAGSAITTTSNTITCEDKCIAAGVHLQHSVASMPAVAANAISDILGPAISVQ